MPHLKIRSSFWFVFAPVALLAIFSSSTQAQSTDNQGLTVIGYSINEVPPARNSFTYPVCGTGTQPFVNVVWEYQQLGSCGEDMFMVRYTGLITIPAHDTIQFWLAADDGGIMKIGTYEWGDWNDKGCSAIETEPMSLPTNQPLAVDGWFYENGGGTCFMLAWNINGQGFEIVPPEAFTTNESEVLPTTSTTNTTSTTSSTLPETTTTRPTSTTSSTTTTAVTTTTITPTLPPLPTASTTEPTTTTTTSSSTTLPPVTTTTTIAAATSTSSTSLPPQMSPIEALSIASDSDAVAKLNVAEAAEVFQALVLENLPPDQLEQVIAAVQDAPLEIRQVFEKEINVFGGAADNYVPVGSSVDVKTRRVIVVTTAFMIAIPPVPTRRKI